MASLLLASLGDVLREVVPDAKHSVDAIFKKLLGARPVPCILKPLSQVLALGSPGCGVGLAGNFSQAFCSFPKGPTFFANDPRGRPAMLRSLLSVPRQHDVNKVVWGVGPLGLQHPPCSSCGTDRDCSLCSVGLPNVRSDGDMEPGLVLTRMLRQAMSLPHCIGLVARDPHGGSDGKLAAGALPTDLLPSDRDTQSR